MSVGNFQRSETRSTWVRNLARFGSVLSVFAMLALLSGCPTVTPTACSTDADCDFCDGEACGSDSLCSGSLDPCPGQSCDEATDSCVDCLADADCDDANVCTVDTCASGTCSNDSTAADADCANADGDFCNGFETCDPTIGDCVDGADPCDPATQVCNEATDQCDDSCSVDADCDPCLGETCGADGLCASGTPIDCSDGDLCTDDVCMDGVCSNPAVVCATGETCDAGVCVGCVTDADCNDGAACTDDTCTAGVCSNVSNCTAPEVCNTTSGACETTGGTPNAFDFTLGDDVLSGGPGDDNFTAGVGTLNPDDIAVGNGGNDTGKLTIVGDTSGAPTLIDIDTINFETLNNATFDAANSAAIGTFNASGDSLGDLTLENVGPGTGLAMGSGFAHRMDVGFDGTPAAYLLTLNGSADGAIYDCNANCGADVTVDVAADSWLGCGAPTADCFGVATEVIVTGSGDLTITGHRATDLAADGGPYDMTDFTGRLTVEPAADFADDFDFSTGGADELDGVDEVTIKDTMTFNRTLTFDNDDTNVTVGIGDIDAMDSAGDLRVDQGTNNDDMLTVNLGGAGDGMGFLDAPTSEFVVINSGGTTDNAIANVTSEAGTNFVTESVTVTGTQNCTLGTVTTERFISTGLDAAAGVTLTAGTSPTQIDTGPGADTITGSGGADLINSGAGDDSVTGAVGADVVTLGAGVDTVLMVVADIPDTITDFTTGEDLFDWNTALSSTDASATTPVFASAAAAGAIAVGTTVHELTGVTVATQTAGNVVTALGASATNADANANILFVIYTTGGGAAIWNWINVDADVEAGELTLVATLDGVVADSLVSDDFK